MRRVIPFDPEAATLLAAKVAATTARVTAVLQRKADRAEALREVAAQAQDEKAFKNAEAIDREVLLFVELVQDFKTLVQQHESDNSSAWAMIELQDKRCTSLKRLADFWQGEHAQQTSQLLALTSAWAADLQRRLAA